MLASVLSANFLPYGAAVVTLVVVARSLWGQLLEAATKISSAIEDAFNKNLSLKLDRARQRIITDSYAQLQSTVELEEADSFDAPLGPSSANVKFGAREEEVHHATIVSAADIFALLKELRATDEAHAEQSVKKRLSGLATTDPYGTESKLIVAEPNEEVAIRKEEFAVLLHSLDLDVTESQTDRLFTMADLDASGFVSQAEFEGAWDDLRDEFINESVRQAGLSSTQVALVVLGIVSLLVLLIVFVLVTVGAWFNNSSFDALFQSALITTLGKASMTLEARSKKAKDGKELDTLVKGIMGQAEADATDQ